VAPYGGIEAQVGVKLDHMVKLRGRLERFQRSGMRNDRLVGVYRGKWRGILGKKTGRISD
jgi:hypothetical protein